MIRPRALLWMLLWTVALAGQSVAHAETGPCHDPRAAARQFLDNLQPDQYLPAEATRCFERPSDLTEAELRRRVGIALAAMTAIDKIGQQSQHHFALPAKGVGRPAFSRLHEHPPTGDCGPSRATTTTSDREPAAERDQFDQTRAVQSDLAPAGEVPLKP